MAQLLPSIFISWVTCSRGANLRDPRRNCNTSHATSFIVNITVNLSSIYLSIISAVHYYKEDRTMPRTYGKKPKQTRLSFNPTGAASPDTQGSPGRQAKLRYGHPSMPVVRPERTRLDFKKQEGQKGWKQRPSSPSPVESSDTDGEEEESRPAPPQDSKKKKGKPARKQKKAIAVDEDDSELEVAPSKRTRNGNRTSKRKRPAVSESEPSQSEEKSDADEIVTRPRRKLRRGAASKPTIVLDDDEDEEKEDEPDLKSQKEKKEDEDEDEPLMTPARRRRRNVVSEDPQTPRRGSDQDNLDIEEDLEDLQDSGRSID